MVENSPPLLGRGAAAIINCNVKLKELGIDSTIKLPSICVIGDQSTGKSSLIESLSTIKSPKASGLCTACPIAINLSSGAAPTSPWLCTIYVEERYTFNKSLDNKRITKERPLGPWEERNVPKITKLATTYNKSKVENLIRQAQLANLNPSTPPMTYFNDSAPESKEVGFSPNIVRLDVSEAQWPNLSFIDLPGIIATTGQSQDKYLVGLVEALAKKYANDPNGVIMLTLPMSGDPENSLAYSLIQNCHAQTRTVPVLTKPDMSSQSQQRLFIPKLQGKSSEFKHGFHVVMMPEAVTDLSTEEARDAETAFFSAEQWQDIDPNRLGVRVLSEFIRNLLFEKTADALPENLSLIRARLGQISQELTALPQPPNSNQLLFSLQHDLGKLKSEISRLGTIDRNDLGQDARRKLNLLSEQFRAKVVHARPTLFIQSHTESSDLKKAESEIQQHNIQGRGTEGQPIECDDEENNQREPQEQTVRATKNKTEMPQFDPVHRFRLEEIRQYNLEHYQATRLGVIEPKALEHMDKLSVQHWNTLLVEFMQKVRDLVNSEVIKCVDMTFGNQRHLEIYTHIHKSVQNYLRCVIDAELEAAVQACYIEQNHPLTLDAETLSQKESTSLAERQLKRDKFRLRLHHAKLEAASGTRSKKKVDIADLGVDPWDLEVRMSAKTRAYYDIAATRFTDSIVQTIFGRLIPKCQAPVVDTLCNDLGVFEPERHQEIVEFLTEDAERERRREHLRHELNRLEAGHRFIELALKNMGETRVAHDESQISDEDFTMIDNVDVTSQTLSHTSSSPSKRKDSGETVEYPKTPSKRARHQSSDTVNDDDDHNIIVFNDSSAAGPGTDLKNRFRAVSLNRTKPDA